MKHRLLALLVLTLLCGCAHNNDPAGPPPGLDDYAFPVNEDQAILNLVDILEARDTAGYLAYVLHPDYTHVFRAGDPYAPAEGWSLADETTAIQNLFGGTFGYDPVQGLPRPAVDEIHVADFDRVDTWRTVDAPDSPFHGTTGALFQVRIDFRSQDTYTVRVEGRVRLYVAFGTVETLSGTRPGWQLCGQEDLDDAKASHDDMFWGPLKRLFHAAG